MTLARPALVVLAGLAALTVARDWPGPVEAQEKSGLPLKAERKIAFQTDEGTWVSLDVSSDGKTLVFELAGDLYTLPMAGGDAKALSTGMAFDSQPRFSPDGGQLAFLSDRDGAENLWVMKADGSYEKKHKATDPGTDEVQNELMKLAIVQLHVTEDDLFKEEKE